MTRFYVSMWLPVGRASIPSLNELLGPKVPNAWLPVISKGSYRMDATIALGFETLVVTSVPMLRVTRSRNSSQQLQSLFLCSASVHGQASLVSVIFSALVIDNATIARIIPEK